MNKKAQGALIIIGGAEDKQGDCVILKKLIELSNKRKGDIVILTAATEYSETIASEYIEIFKRLGVNNTNAAHIQTRKDADSQYNSMMLEKAACIFFTGGDQLRITSLMGGTQTEKALRKAYEQGAVIAGTSAGASVMSETMITSGNEDDAPRKCTLKMAPGLGLLSGVVIDQHFAQRGRIGRLLTAIAQNPTMLGIGIDEDTAIVISNNSIFEIIGSHAVTILDAHGSEFTNVSEMKPDDILAITNITMHVLPAGYHYDINLRKAIIRR